MDRDHVDASRDGPALSTRPSGLPGRAGAALPAAASAPLPAVRLVTIALLALILVAACDAPSSGRPASSAGPDSPVPTAGATPMLSPEAAVTTFELSSTAFAPGGSIPGRFTCDGEDVSPDLAWSGTPDGTGALVLVVDDPDARGFVHWLVLDLAPAAEGALPLGVSAAPDAPQQGTNDFGRTGWGGPCPPSGEHRYVFTLSALTAPLGLSGAPGRAEVDAALGGATVLGTAVLEGRYRRGG